VQDESVRTTDACYDWAKTFRYIRGTAATPVLTSDLVVIDYETFCKIRDCHDRPGPDDRADCPCVGPPPQTVATWVARSRFEPP